MPEGAWRLNDGNSVVTAYIKDESFVASVQNGDIRLDRSSVLVCRTRVKQYTNAQGELATEHIVEEVVEVREEFSLFAELQMEDQDLIEIDANQPRRSRRRSSKYTPLRNFLVREASEGRDDVVLSYRQIETLVGASLPQSAYGQRTIGLWWRNDASHTQARNGWLAARWWVQSIDRKDKRVYFTRQR